MRRTTPKPPVLRERKRSLDTPIPDANRKLGQPGLNSPKSGGTLDDSTVSSIIGNLANCSNAITLDCLRALYDFEYDPVVPEKNSYGIVEYTPQAYVPSDLDMFFKKFEYVLLS
jgi:tripeptidyl-peptidase I